MICTNEHYDTRSPFCFGKTLTIAAYYVPELEEALSLAKGPLPGEDRLLLFFVLELLQPDSVKSGERAVCSADESISIDVSLVVGVRVSLALLVRA